LEMKDGIPMRIFFLKDSFLKEFLQVIDNETEEVIDVHIGRIIRRKFDKYRDVTIHTYLGKEGILWIGGGRPLVDGSLPKKPRYWAKFGIEHENEKVAVVVKEGVVFRVFSLETDLDVEFALVWKKSEKKYTTSFWGKLFENEFNLLNEDYEIHNYRLSKDGSLHLGGREDWIDFGAPYSYKRVDIIKILNPTGKKAFILAATVKNEKGEPLITKELSLIYTVSQDAPAESFAKEDLVEVFEKLRRDKLILPDGTKLETYVISNIKVDTNGILDVGGYWGKFSYFPGAEVEAKVVDGEKRFVKFIKDKEGNPILDVEGNPLVVDVKKSIKRQILKRSQLLQSLRSETSRELYTRAEKLLSEGRYRKAKKLFSEIIRIRKRRVIPIREEEELSEKAKSHIEELRRKEKLEKRQKRLEKQKLKKQQKELKKQLSCIQTLYQKGKKLFSQRKYKQAICKFKHLIRILRKNLTDFPERENLLVKAKKYLEICQGIEKERKKPPVPFTIKNYYNDPKTFSSTEEVELMRKIQEGDKKAKSLFVESYIWLVKRVVAEIFNPSSNYYEDLISEGVIRLYEIVDRYTELKLNSKTVLPFQDYVKEDLKRFYKDLRKQNNRILYRNIFLEAPLRESHINHNSRNLLTLEKIPSGQRISVEEEVINKIRLEELKKGIFENEILTQAFRCLSKKEQEIILSWILNSFPYGVQSKEKEIKKVLDKLRKLISEFSKNGRASSILKKNFPPFAYEAYKQIGKEGWKKIPLKFLKFYTVISMPELIFFLSREIKNKKILSVGSGRGELEKELARNNQIICVNIVLEMAKAVKNQDLKTIVADVHHLPFKSNFFDVVIFPYSLPHMDAFKSLFEAKRVLKTKGKLIIINPKFTSSQNTKNLAEGFYRLKELSAIVRKAGFKIIYKTEKPLLPSLFSEESKEFSIIYISAEKSSSSLFIRKKLEMMKEEIEKINKVFYAIGNGNCAEELSFYLAKKNFNILHLSKSGIYQALGRGIKKAQTENLINAKSVGVVTKRYNFSVFTNLILKLNYIFLQKIALTKHSDSFVFFPADFRTLDILFEILVLIQTKKTRKRKIILFGEDYWQRWHEWIRKTLLKKRYIKEDDLNLFKITNRVEETIKELTSSSSLIKEITKEKVEELLNKGEKGIILLQKAIFHPKEGGIDLNKKELRRYIWEKLIEKSFGGKEKIKVINKDEIPHREKQEYIKKLGHVIIKGKLPKSGELSLGKFHIKSEAYANLEYELEMKDGIPMRIFFLKDSFLKEFLQVRDNETGEIIDVYIGKIPFRKFVKYKDVTIYTYLKKEGMLWIGGGRPLVDGSLPKKPRFWAHFGAAHENEKVGLIAKEGIIFRVFSLETDLDVEFALVWKKSIRKYTTSFWEKLSEDEFNLLNEDYEIHNYRLNKCGLLYLGGKYWVNFGKLYSHKRADIIKILNPTGKKAFILSVTVKDEEGKPLITKELSLIYKVPKNTPPESFEKGELIGVFRNLKSIRNKLILPDGTELKSYIISNIRTDKKGILEVGDYWLSISQFPEAKVEAKVINGEKRFVKFIEDREGYPILDDKGNRVVVDVKYKKKPQTVNVRKIFQIIKYLFNEREELLKFKKALQGEKRVEVFENFVKDAEEKIKKIKENEEKIILIFILKEIEKFYPVKEIEEIYNRFSKDFEEVHKEFEKVYEEYKKILQEFYERFQEVFQKLCKRRRKSSKSFFRKIKKLQKEKKKKEKEFFEEKRKEFEERFRDLHYQLKKEGWSLKLDIKEKFFEIKNYPSEKINSLIERLSVSQEELKEKTNIKILVRKVLEEILKKNSSSSIFEDKFLNVRLLKDILKETENSLNIELELFGSILALGDRKVPYELLGDLDIRVGLGYFDKKVLEKIIKTLNFYLKKYNTNAKVIKEGDDFYLQRRWLIFPLKEKILISFYFSSGSFINPFELNGLLNRCLSHINSSNSDEKVKAIKRTLLILKGFNPEKWKVQIRKLHKTLKINSINEEEIFQELNKIWKKIRTQGFPIEVLERIKSTSYKTSSPIDFNNDFNEKIMERVVFQARKESKRRNSSSSLDSSKVKEIARKYGYVLANPYPKKSEDKIALIERVSSDKRVKIGNGKKTAKLKDAEPGTEYIRFVYKGITTALYLISAKRYIQLILAYDEARGKLLDSFLTTIFCSDLERLLRSVQDLLRLEFVPLLKNKSIYFAGRKWITNTKTKSTYAHLLMKGESLEKAIITKVYWPVENKWEYTSLIYNLDSKETERYFYKKVTPQELKKLTNHKICNFTLNSWGQLYLGGKVIFQSPRYSNAVVDVIVRKGKPIKIIFKQTKDEFPILDKDGRPLSIDLTSKISTQKQLTKRASSSISREEKIHRHRICHFDSLQEAERVSDYYKLDKIKEIQPVDSNISGIVLIITETKKFVLKKSPWDEKGAILEYYLISFLNKKDPNFPLPKIILNKYNLPFTEFNNNIYFLYTYIEGKTLSLQELNSSQFKDALRKLSQLHHYTLLSPRNLLRASAYRECDSLMNFKGGRDKRLIRFQNYYERIKEEKDSPFKELIIKSYPLILKVIEELKEKFQKTYLKLPKSIIHGDYTLSNLKFSNKEVVGVFDFDTAREEIRAYDLTRTDLYEIDEKLEFDSFINLINTYQNLSLHPLNNLELESFPYLIALAFLHKLFWLVRWNTREKVNTSKSSYQFFVKILKTLENLRNKNYLQKYWKDVIFASSAIKKYCLDSYTPISPSITGLANMLCVGRGFKDLTESKFSDGDIILVFYSEEKEGALLHLNFTSERDSNLNEEIKEKIKKFLDFTFQKIKERNVKCILISKSSGPEKKIVKENLNERGIRFIELEIKEDFEKISLDLKKGELFADKNKIFHFIENKELFKGETKKLVVIGWLLFTPTAQPTKRLIFLPYLQSGAWYLHPSTIAIIKVMLKFKNIFKGKIILDIGSGRGDLCIIASKLGAKKVYGVEINKELVELSKKVAFKNNVKNIEFINEDFKKLSLSIRPHIILINISKTQFKETVEFAMKRFFQTEYFIITGFSTKKDSDEDKDLDNFVRNFGDILYKEYYEQILYKEICYPVFVVKSFYVKNSSHFSSSPLKRISFKFVELLNLLNSYQKERIIKNYYITGSFAKGEWKSHSDIDIAITPTAKYSVEIFSQLKDLEEKIKRISDRFHLTLEAFGPVYEIKKEKIVFTGKIEKEDIFLRLPEKKRGILIRLDDYFFEEEIPNINSLENLYSKILKSKEKVLVSILQKLRKINFYEFSNSDFICFHESSFLKIEVPFKDIFTECICIVFLKNKKIFFSHIKPQAQIENLKEEWRDYIFFDEEIFSEDTKVLMVGKVREKREFVRRLQDYLILQGIKKENIKIDEPPNTKIDTAGIFILPSQKIIITSYAQQIEGEYKILKINGYNIEEFSFCPFYTLEEILNKISASSSLNFKDLLKDIKEILLKKYSTSHVKILFFKGILKKENESLTVGVELKTLHGKKRVVIKEMPYCRAKQGMQALKILGFYVPSFEEEDDYFILEYVGKMDLEEFYKNHAFHFKNELFTEEFSFSLAEASLGAYLIGIADRSPSNLRIEFNPLKIFNIDFVSSFTIKEPDFNEQKFMLEKFINVLREFNPSLEDKARDWFIKKFLLRFNYIKKNFDSIKEKGKDLLSQNLWQEIERKIEVSCKDIVSIFREKKTSSPVKKWTKEKIIEWLKNPPPEVKDPRNSVSWQKAGYRDVPHYAYFFFGSWHNALKAAGIKPLERKKRKEIIYTFCDWKRIKEIIPDLIDFQRSQIRVVGNRKLKEEELNKLIEELHKGNKAALIALIALNIPLVKWVIKKRFKRPPEELPELINIGTFGCPYKGTGKFRHGLILAIESFDPKRGIKFSPYATLIIERAIREYLKEKERKEKIELSIEDLQLQLNPNRVLFNLLKEREKRDRERINVNLKEIEREIEEDFKEAVRIFEEKLKENGLKINERHKEIYKLWLKRKFFLQHPISKLDFETAFCKYKIPYEEFREFKKRYREFTLQKIGERFGISKQRVEQIVKRINSILIKNNVFSSSSALKKDEDWAYEKYLEVFEEFLKEPEVKKAIENKIPLTTYQIVSLIEKRFKKLSKDLDEKSPEFKKLYFEKERLKNIVQKKFPQTKSMCLVFVLCNGLLPYVVWQLPQDRALEIYIMRDGMFYLLSKKILRLLGINVGSENETYFYLSRIKMGVPLEFIGLINEEEKEISNSLKKQFEESVYKKMENMIFKSYLKSRIEKHRLGSYKVNVERFFKELNNEFELRMKEDKNFKELAFKVWLEIKEKITGYNKVRIIDIFVYGGTLLFLSSVINYFSKKEGLKIKVEMFKTSKGVYATNLPGFSAEKINSEEIIKLLKNEGFSNVDIQYIMSSIDKYVSQARFVEEFKIKSDKWGHIVEYDPKSQKFTFSSLDEQLLFYARLLYMLNGAIILFNCKLNPQNCSVPLTTYPQRLKAADDWFEAHYGKDIKATFVDIGVGCCVDEENDLLVPATTLELAKRFPQLQVYGIDLIIPQIAIRYEKNWRVFWLVFNQKKEIFLLEELREQQIFKGNLLKPPYELDYQQVINLINEINRKLRLKDISLFKIIDKTEPEKILLNKEIKILINPYEIAKRFYGVENLEFIECSFEELRYKKDIKFDFGRIFNVSLHFPPFEIYKKLKSLTFIFKEKGILIEGNTLPTEEDLIFGIYEIYRGVLQLKEIYLPSNLCTIYRWEEGKIDLEFFPTVIKIEKRYKEIIKILEELCERYKYNLELFLKALREKGYEVEKLGELFCLKFKACLS